MKVIETLAWLGVLGCAALALILFFAAKSAPQEAAAAALVVIPYCGARAIQGLRRIDPKAPSLQDGKASEKKEQPAGATLRER